MKNLLVSLVLGDENDYFVGIGDRFVSNSNQNNNFTLYKINKIIIITKLSYYYYYY